jgi:uncharacterized membrane protein (DUF485 family)
MGVHVAQIDDPGRFGVTTDVAADAYRDIYDSAEFAELRSRFRKLVIPLTLGFLAWYFAYVLMATYKHAWMSHNVAGNFNRGFFFGLLQFVSTFLVAFVYAKRAETEIDPLAEQLNKRYDELHGGGAS